MKLGAKALHFILSYNFYLFKFQYFTKRRSGNPS